MFDAVLTVLSSIYLTSLLNNRYSFVNIAETSPVSALASTDSRWLVSCKVALVAAFRTVLLLFACLPALSRSDVFAYVLVVLAMQLLWSNQLYTTSVSEQQAAWGRLQWTNFALIFSRMLWSLVAG